MEQQPPNNVEELYQDDSAFGANQRTFIEEDVQEISKPLVKSDPIVEVPKVFEYSTRRCANVFFDYNKIFINLWRNDGDIYA